MTPSDPENRSPGLDALGLGEVFHLAFAVSDLHDAMGTYQSLAGGTRTDPADLEALVHAPLLSSEPIRIRGRVCWRVGNHPPIEFWQGEPGSPWHSDRPGMDFHHVAYYVDDLDDAATALRASGFEMEITPYHRGDGILGFAYLRHPGGLRVEIQGSADRAAMEAWMRGEPLVIDWFDELQ